MKLTTDQKKSMVAVAVDLFKLIVEKVKERRHGQKNRP
jgi:hypothetical protein